MRFLAAAHRVGKQIVNVPSFLVRVDSQKHIDFALNSPFGGGRPGRNKRKAQKCAPPPAPVNFSRGKNTPYVACKREQQKMHQVVVADMPACLPCNCYKACKSRGTHEIV